MVHLSKFAEFYEEMIAPTVTNFYLGAPVFDLKKKFEYTVDRFINATVKYFDLGAIWLVCYKK